MFTVPLPYIQMLSYNYHTSACLILSDWFLANNPDLYRPTMSCYSLAWLVSVIFHEFLWTFQKRLPYHTQNWKIKCMISGTFSRTVIPIQVSHTKEPIDRPISQQTVKAGKFFVCWSVLLMPDWCSQSYNTTLIEVTSSSLVTSTTRHLSPDG